MADWFAAGAFRTAYQEPTSQGRGEQDDESGDRQRQRPAAGGCLSGRRLVRVLRRRRSLPPRIAERLLQRGAVGPLGPPVRADHVPPAVPERQHQRVRVVHRTGDRERPESRAEEPTPPSLKLFRAYRRDDDERLVPVAVQSKRPRVPIGVPGSPGWGASRKR